MRGVRRRNVCCVGTRLSGLEREMWGRQCGRGRSGGFLPGVPYICFLPAGVLKYNKFTSIPVYEVFSLRSRPPGVDFCFAKPFLANRVDFLEIKAKKQI